MQSTDLKHLQNIMPLKVGLIGCGRIAQLVHLNILTRLPNAELVALAEADPQRLEEAKRRAPGAVAFADYQQLLEMPEVGALVICLPNALHAAATVAALERGKHVYLEKPLATNLGDARCVLEAWKRANVVAMMGFNYRFNALYQATKRQIESGRLGELVAARSVFSTAAQTLPDWKSNRQSGGGVLLDLASHHIDLIRFFFRQEAQEVFAETRSQCSESDSATLQLRLADGLLVQSFFSLSAVEEDRFEIYGQAGKLSVDRYLSLDVRVTSPTLRDIRFNQLRHGLRALKRCSYLLDKIRAPASEPSYLAALANFVAAAKANRPTAPDFLDGYRSQEVIEAAEESARTRAVVALPF
jgi:myo-inositol 2-dehydrogenase/D-chiro-inositol 1-dehydrogenase